MNYKTLGILAHVDAGKTTLSEALLYQCGTIRKLGRVDHQDAFLDHFSLERERGITIFSKQAQLSLSDKLSLCLLDTPGHVDFSAEMERVLAVLDFAILVISGADGVQGHTKTLWRLLKQYQVPVLIFINKMDQPGTDSDVVMKDLQANLSDQCVEFHTSEHLWDAIKASFEAIATCDETALNEYLNSNELQPETIKKMFWNRLLFPCIFGSALRLQGIEQLIATISFFSDQAASNIPTDHRSTPGMTVQNASLSNEALKTIDAPGFGARVFKISRDEQGNRLTHLKITAGSLRVKSVLSHQIDGEVIEEKINQIRIYSGNSFELVQEAKVGQICTITGPMQTFCGEGLGIETANICPVLEPVLNYRLILPEDTDVHKAFLTLRQLEEENPLLDIRYIESGQTGEIQVRVMGEIELEVLKSLIQERYHYEVTFGSGSLIYKETIASNVEGVGHFEPLRHYAEVHLLLEPGEPGSGITVDTDCSEDDLNKNWQRLIVTHILECEHPGVLTGSSITDMRITLIGGKAHTKHTEGGDFRQATYRAIRQGLMKAQNVLLEPFYEYQLEVPAEHIGHAISDIEQMSGTFTGPDIHGEMAYLTGTAPVSTMSGYQAKLNGYTHGLGKLFCSLKGYQPCHDAEQIVDQCHYDPEADTAHPCHSVFCSHGAGIIIPWYEVEEYMHVTCDLQKYGILTDNEHDVDHEMESGIVSVRDSSRKKSQKNNSYSSSEISIGEDEIREIFERTYGAGSMDRKFYNRDEWDYEVKDSAQKDIVQKYSSKKTTTKKEEYLLVDGYNVIFAWEDLNELSKVNLEAARNKLMDVMCNYQGYRQMNLILVFDAYKVKGNLGEMFDYHNIHVVYTKEAETADQYIEKLAHKISKDYDVTVATSDGLEQLIVLGAGAKRISSRNLREEVDRMEQEIKEKYI